MVLWYFGFYRMIQEDCILTEWLVAGTAVSGNIWGVYILHFTRLNLSFFFVITSPNTPLNPLLKQMSAIASLFPMFNKHTISQCGRLAVSSLVWETHPTPLTAMSQVSDKLTLAAKKTSPDKKLEQKQHSPRLFRADRQQRTPFLKQKQ